MFYRFIAVSLMVASVLADTVTYYSSNDCSGTGTEVSFSPTCASTSGGSTCIETCKVVGSDSFSYTCLDAAPLQSVSMTWSAGATDCTAPTSSVSTSFTGSTLPTGCQTGAPSGSFMIGTISCSGGGCFPSDTSVQLEDGRRIDIADVNVGDKVLSVSADNKYFYDKVFRITEHDTSAAVASVKLSTASATLQLTPNHFVHSTDGECCSPETLKQAGDLKVGDTLFVAKPDGIKGEPIVSVERVMQKGIHNVHTIHSNIVVNGVVASHFTTETTWSPDTRGWAPTWYSLLDALPFAAQNAKEN